MPLCLLLVSPSLHLWETRQRIRRHWMQHFYGCSEIRVDRGVEAVNARVLFDALHRADGHEPSEDLHVDIVLLSVYGIYA